ncbi:MAG: hypothetical protein ACHRXM_30805 [Isosphaerales bacterium]
MGSTSRMLLVLSVLGTTASSDSSDSPRSDSAIRTTSAAHSQTDRKPIKRAAYQSSRSPARFSARWIGQDGHDHVGPSNQLKPSDVQDIHIALGGLDPRREVVFVDVTGHGGDQWRYETQASCWRAELERNKQSRTADLFIEPGRVETGRVFHVVVRYDDGSTVETDFRGRKADPNLRMLGAAVAARWIGQDRQDWAGPGPSVGPDGLQDVRIHLSKLSAQVAVKVVRIEGPAGARWEFGTNPKLLSNAELIRDPKDPSQGDLFFQPDRDLSAQRIKLTVAYENEKVDTATLVAGRCDPKLRMPQAPLPKFNERAITAKWLGQDGENPAGPGDVHVVITGLPASSPMVGAVLSDAVWGTWIYRANDRVTIPADPFALPLVVRPRSDRNSADLYLAPYRDESKDTLTLRLIGADGRSLLARFPGGSCDLSRRAPQPEAGRIEAKPGDDLQALVDRYGTVVLAKGTYRLTRPLVLSRPVTLTSEGGATLRFAQAGAEPPWTAAIKVHCGNTTLNGFAVRFEGPIRWNEGVEWGPAVIGMTDNFDQGHDELRVNIGFTRLDLEVPPVENRGGWLEALRLMRLKRAQSGVIEGNTLRGGPIEFLDGPWRIVDNDFQGTLPGTYSHGVFEGHGTHDLLIRGNRTRSVAPSGKTWRFLVLTWFGANDVIERNTIEQIGARDDDTIPWSNEPEIIVTEAYHVRYEGKVMALSGDGRLLRIGRPHGDAARTGEVVSLLKGPAAGQWRRIVQIIDPSTFLVDPPIPAGTEVVSISPGFVGEVFQENRIDLRGGRRSDSLCFIGNHFGTRVIRNHLLGGGHGFRMTACPTETPLIWGWSHAPFLGGVIEGNIIEDTERGGVLGLEHDPRSIKSNVGRTYMAVQLRENVVRWTEPFLKTIEGAGAKQPLAGLTLGYPPSDDPGELVVAAVGNRLEAPSGRDPGPSLLIHAADYNSQRIVNRRLPLSSDGTAAAPDRRGANAKAIGPLR